MDIAWLVKDIFCRFIKVGIGKPAERSIYGEPNLGCVDVNPLFGIDPTIMLNNSRNDPSRVLKHLTKIISNFTKAFDYQLFISYPNRQSSLSSPFRIG
jgi:hypothetical protein